jgi:hypothetical protein
MNGGEEEYIYVLVGNSEGKRQLKTKTYVGG